MCAMQRPNPYQQNQPPQPPQQEDEQPELRFRWGLLAVPITVALFLWFVTGMKIGFGFADIAGLLGVVQMNRYVLLAGLAVLCITVLCLVRWFRRR